MFSVVYVGSGSIFYLVNNITDMWILGDLIVRLFKNAGRCFRSLVFGLVEGEISSPDLCRLSAPAAAALVEGPSFYLTYSKKKLHYITQYPLELFVYICTKKRHKCLFLEYCIQR